MQPLTRPRLADNLRLAGNIILITLDLPVDERETNQFIDQLAQATRSHVINSNWGADRFQAEFEHVSHRFYLHIEWNCEAMWLECQQGNENIAQLLDLLTQ
ncbi:DUF3630 family protein [Alteromonas ponticola]|uniref:DUF3630 family protein n=1 Tax=Alteromonas ponticola TaxID=2720613 RepID=A0ABX1R094_9ALTE|nr:DUF3630 family protein [Alteromonas ponticola]NMH59900.1 DUF3630 family protein [Alteromonas ponticola]